MHWVRKTYSMKRCCVWKHIIENIQGYLKLSSWPVYVAGAVWAWLPQASCLRILPQSCLRILPQSWSSCWQQLPAVSLLVSCSHSWLSCPLEIHFAPCQLHLLWTLSRTSWDLLGLCRSADWDITVYVGHSCSAATFSVVFGCAGISYVYHISKQW